MDRTAPRRPTPPTRETITVYVRKVDDEARSLAFRLPDFLNQGDLIRKRVAVDGNQAIWVVGPTPTRKHYHGRFSVAPQDNLTDALAEEQVALIEWANQRGYEVTFK
jgi:hypothetical protein